MMASALSATTDANTPQPTKGRYRPEIDGLRAFAVVAVIINHFNKDLLPSGYLGVDIFFVISGYVITSSLAGRKSKNFLDFLTGFYERRIKRILPALALFILSIGTVICVFAPGQLGTIRTGALSLLGASNLYLWFQSTDYFGQSSELNVFTHTWSLGVEEQFYLLFPFLIWFSGFGQQSAKGARNLFFWVGALTIASLTSFIYLYQVNQPAAYFLMPPRFWEMAAGCLIFIAFQRRAKVEQALEQVPPLLIVAAMVGVMFLPVEAAVSATVGIVVLSAVLIACLKKGSLMFATFTSKILTHTGKISYSLYLWHWGVLVLSRWTIGIHWWSIPFQVAMILSLSEASHRFVETPARRYKSTRVNAYAAGFLITIPLFLYLWIILYQKGGTLYAGPKSLLLQSTQPENQELISINPGNPKSPKAFFLGDCQIGQSWWYAKNSLFDKGYSIYVHPRNRGVTFKSNVSMDTYLHKDFIEGPLQRYKNIISEGDIIGIAVKSPRKLLGPTKEAILSTIKLANQKKARVIIFGQIPVYPALSYDICQQTWYRPGFTIHGNCEDGMDSSEALRMTYPANSFYSNLSLKYKNVYYFDQVRFLCPPREKRCKTKEGAKYLYYDGAHLTREGADLMKSSFSKFLADIESIK
jgi:peptidoglycan/LPS O-acetylase OafA/YrhL